MVELQRLTNGFAALEEEILNFGRGTNCRAWELLGCHYLGDGTYGFRVWAPEASAVSLVGDFNGWEPGLHPLEALGGGIWECQSSQVGEYDPYKYAITGPDGKTVMKADPYGFHFETRPSNASKVYNLEGYVWGDGDWLRRKEENSIYDCPVNIYEVHAGSWRQYPDGSPFSYDKLADELIP